MTTPTEGTARNTPPIKPGTRCECGEEHHPDTGEHIGTITGEDCPNGAARMVTVPTGRAIIDATGYRAEYVPMCSACANWHESKAAPRYYGPTARMVEGLEAEGGAK